MHWHINDCVVLKPPASTYTSDMILELPELGTLIPQKGAEKQAQSVQGGCCSKLTI